MNAGGKRQPQYDTDVSTACLARRDWRLRYATNRNDLAVEFYVPCLQAASAYDRAVGYFRSSTFMAVTREIADFALRGGKMRLVASPELTEADIDSLARGYELRDLIRDTVMRTIESAVVRPDLSYHVEFLATLVAAKALDLKLALRPGAHGIFHDKVGVFSDADGHALSFTGSLNESLTAWDPDGNHESFDVFRSWSGGDGEQRVLGHQEYFDSLWRGVEPGVQILDFPEAARQRLLVIANSDGIEAAYEKAARAMKPLPDRMTPMQHQLDALESWERNGRRGVLAHATASGKTVTAIEAMRTWLTRGCPVLVIVPSDLLLRQWRRELSRQLSDLDIPMLLCGAGNSNWSASDAVAAFTASDGGPRIVLATLQTASTAEFIRRCRPGEHLMIVCDEVHRAGAPEYSRITTLETGPRLGLSASADRYGDPEGTRRIRDYFGRDLEPPFGIEDGIRVGRLVPYTYHVHFVELTDQERIEWRRLTKEIRRLTAMEYSNQSSNGAFSERVKMLLIRRARIVKQARAKIPFAIDFLREQYEPGDRWLVYCDDQEQLGNLLDGLAATGVPASEYYAAMEGDRVATLDYFAVTGGVLLAIRCLDEGVDIPAADHALVLASSRNPREFIQRRGRLLRVSDGKHSAEIHDVLVVPSNDAEPDDLAVLRAEIERAQEFSLSASNDAVKFRLRAAARELGLGAVGAEADVGTEGEAEDAEPA